MSALYQKLSVQAELELDSWLGTKNIVISARKRRELSDVVNMAKLFKEVVGGKLAVNLKHYTSHGNLAGKLVNWEAFNLKVLRKSGLILMRPGLELLAKGDEKALRSLLYHLMLIDVDSIALSARTGSSSQRSSARTDPYTGPQVTITANTPEKVPDQSDARSEKLMSDYKDELIATLTRRVAFLESIIREKDGHIRDLVHDMKMITDRFIFLHKQLDMDVPIALQRDDEFFKTLLINYTSSKEDLLDGEPATVHLSNDNPTKDDQIFEGLLGKDVTSPDFDISSALLAVQSRYPSEDKSTHFDVKSFKSMLGKDVPSADRDLSSDAQFEKSVLGEDVPSTVHGDIVDVQSVEDLPHEFSFQSFLDESKSTMVKSFKSLLGKDVPSADRDLSSDAQFEKPLLGENVPATVHGDIIDVQSVEDLPNGLSFLSFLDESKSHEDGPSTDHDVSSVYLDVNSVKAPSDEDEPSTGHDLPSARQSVSDFPHGHKAATLLDGKELPEEDKHKALLHNESTKALLNDVKLIAALLDDDKSLEEHLGDVQCVKALLLQDKPLGNLKEAKALLDASGKDLLDEDKSTDLDDSQELLGEDKSFTNYLNVHTKKALLDEEEATELDVKSSLLLDEEKPTDLDVEDVEVEEEKSFTILDLHTVKALLDEHKLTDLDAKSMQILLDEDKLKGYLNNTESASNLLEYVQSTKDLLNEVKRSIANLDDGKDKSTVATHLDDGESVDPMLDEGKSPVATHLDDGESVDPTLDEGISPVLDDGESVDPMLDEGKSPVGLFNDKSGESLLDEGISPVLDDGESVDPMLDEGKSPVDLFDDESGESLLDDGISPVLDDGESVDPMIDEGKSPVALNDVESSKKK